MEKTDIRSLNLEELKAWFKERGEKPFRAGQLYQWMHQKLAGSFDEMTNLSKGLREKLAGVHSLKASGDPDFRDRRHAEISF